ncbi:MAG TPA: Zn-ribbon containing protein [Candidatus Nanoarchaeia archaeon]|nr:Zn-ribbon containing protein [Candidatus Nanoarchaeia archaeon]
MPHQCVRCSVFYDDGAQEILKGCPCGGRLFFFVKKEKLEAAKNLVPQNLEPAQKQQIEKDVLELVGGSVDDVPVVLDFESVRVLEPGKYQLDLVQLFKGEPLVFRLEEGKYVIDIQESFQKLKKR